MSNFHATSALGARGQTDNIQTENVNSFLLSFRLSDDQHTLDKTGQVPPCLAVVIPESRHVFLPRRDKRRITEIGSQVAEEDKGLFPSFRLRFLPTSPYEPRELNLQPRGQQLMLNIIEMCSGDDITQGGVVPLAPATTTHREGCWRVREILSNVPFSG